MTKKNRSWSTHSLSKLNVKRTKSMWAKVIRLQKICRETKTGKQPQCEGISIHRILKYSSETCYLLKVSIIETDKNKTNVYKSCYYRTQTLNGPIIFSINAYFVFLYCSVSIFLLTSSLPFDFSPSTPSPHFSSPQTSHPLFRAVPPRLSASTPACCHRPCRWHRLKYLWGVLHFTVRVWAARRTQPTPRTRHFDKRAQTMLLQQPRLSQTHQSSLGPDASGSVASVCGANGTVSQAGRVKHTRSPAPVSHGNPVFLVIDERGLMRPSSHRGLELRR